MTTTYEIASYLCFQYSSKPGIVALITLYDDLVSIRGRLNFYPDGADLPDAEEDTSSGRVILHLPVSRFASTVDLLRNESPIEVVYNTPKEAYLSAGNPTPPKPVGD